MNNKLINKWTYEELKKKKKIIKRKKNIISLNCILRFKKFEKLGITWVKQKRKFKKKKQNKK